MNAIRNLVLLGLVAPALSITAAQAAQPGFYLGGSFGQTFVDVDGGDLGLDDSDINIDDDDSGWKAYLGYNFNSWLGVEAGYKDFGGVSDKFFGTPVDLDITGYDGFLVGSLPLGPVDLFAKVGAINLQADVNFGSQNEDDNEVELAYGVGMALNAGHWAFRLEAEGFEDNEVDDFYFVSAGVTYSFGREKKADHVVASAAPAPAPAPVQASPDADGDGVSDANDLCADTATGARVDTIGCNCDYVLNLRFGFDSAELHASDKTELDRIATVMTDVRAGSIRGTVAGHTDSSGPESYNQGLSERRAEAVVNYLGSRGVATSSFSTRGYGETSPVASNDTEAGRAQNRRIELRRTDCGS